MELLGLLVARLRSAGSSDSGMRASGLLIWYLGEDEVVSHSNSRSLKDLKDLKDLDVAL